MKTLLMSILVALVVSGEAGEAGKSTDLASIAKQILVELRLLDSMSDRYAIENNLSDGLRLSPAQLLTLPPTATPAESNLRVRLAKAVENQEGVRDLLGNPYDPIVVSGVPRIHPDTFAALAVVAPREFWGEHAPASPQPAPAIRRPEK